MAKKFFRVTMITAIVLIITIVVYIGSLFWWYQHLGYKIYHSTTNGNLNNLIADIKVFREMPYATVQVQCMSDSDKKVTIKLNRSSYKQITQEFKQLEATSVSVNKSYNHINYFVNLTRMTMFLLPGSHMDQDYFVVQKDDQYYYDTNEGLKLMPARLIELIGLDNLGRQVQPNTGEN